MQTKDESVAIIRINIPEVNRSFLEKLLLLQFAVVNGYSLVEDSCEIALECDIRIGSANAKIAKQKLQLAFHEDWDELRG